MKVHGWPMNVVSMRRPVVNSDELDFEEWGHGTRFPGAVDPQEKYKARKSEIGQRLGARKLDYRLMVLAPGKCALPFHAHMFNEEMFFIVSGTGVLRYGGG